MKRFGLMCLAVVTCGVVILSTPVVAQEGQPSPNIDHNTVQIAAQNTGDRQEIKQSTVSLIDQGSDLFASGHLAAAAEMWQQAAAEYRAQGKDLAQARARHYLAISYFNMGQWQLAQQANTESRTLLKEVGMQEVGFQEVGFQETAGTAQTGESLLGANLNLQGQLQLVFGQPEQSIDTWKQAAVAYEAAGDLTGKLGAQLNQAKALQTLGHHQQSQQLLEKLRSAIHSQSDLTVKVTGLKLLGTALQGMGDLVQSQALLTEGLEIAQQLSVETAPAANQVTHQAAHQAANQISALRISLGQTLAARQETVAALEEYRQAAAIATNPQSQIEAQLNQLQLLVKTEAWPQTQPFISMLPGRLEILPPSRESVYATVNFAASWIQVAQSTEPSLTNPPLIEPSLTEPLATEVSAIEPLVKANASPTTVQSAEIAQLLANAVQVSRSLSDTRAEAFALGQLGHLYETAQQWSEAQKLTQQAVTLAEGIDAPDLNATWQWQLGRLLKQQGQQTEAIAAYSHSVASLKSLRQSLSSLNPDRQFSYLETVEPVYRELVALLLEGDADQGQLQQAQLQQARELIESLQLAELDNFFHQACLQATPQLIDTVDATAAVLYPIILPDRLAVILSRPGQPLVHYETLLPQSELEATLDQLRRYLNPHFFEADRLQLSQQVYDWLIRPAEGFLAETQTLVFVLDGALRNLPMAALYDGQQYLIERYSIALSPGLQLLEPQPLDSGQLNVLTGGLSEAQPGFPALPAVDTEVSQIAATLPATTLLNQTFTTDRLSQTLQKTPFSVVHLATHGQFSSRADETFLLTWDGRLNVQDLDAMLLPRRREVSQPLALLVLSACQTATGDQRAALGLAGMAIRSGARSTLATLWQVNDNSTAVLMKQFYEQLLETPGMTKAEALRAAQLHLLKQSQYQDPIYWAPFVLIGNWL
ncbi:MAG: CHAT domain-containing protein [Cyanobacteria bacterium P01_F01_bin.53]